MAYFIIVFLIVLLLICWSGKSDNKQSYEAVIEENRCLKRDVIFLKFNILN